MSTFVTLVKDSLFSIVFHLAPRFANVLLFILIGRLAGPTEAGTFALATTYLLIFTTIMRGIDDLIVREVSRKPEKAIDYLFNFLLLRLGLAIFMYGVLWFVVVVIFDYGIQTTYLILILGLSVIPDSLTYVAQAIFLGNREFKMPAVVFAIISLLKLAVGAIVLFNYGKLSLVAWTWLFGSLLGTAVLLPATVKKFGGLKRSRRFYLNSTLITSHRQTIITFLLLTTLTTLETQSDTILLSGFHGEAEVGWYGAATTVAYSLIMFSQAYRFAVYPLMNRYAIHAPEKLVQLYRQSLHYLLLLVLPMIAGINILSDEIVPLIFGSDFTPTVNVLNILIFTLFFMFLNEPNIRVLLAYDQQNRILLFLLIGAGLNIVLNFLLTPSMGAVGAAVARVSSAFVLFLLSHFYANQFFVSVNFLKLLSKPLIAVLLMILAVMPFRTGSLFLSVSLGGITYLLALVILGSISNNDIKFLRQAILNKTHHIPKKTKL